MARSILEQERCSPALLAAFDASARGRNYVAMEQLLALVLRPIPPDASIAPDDLVGAGLARRVNTDLKSTLRVSALQKLAGELHSPALTASCTGGELCGALEDEGLRSRVMAALDSVEHFCVAKGVSKGFADTSSRETIVNALRAGLDAYARPRDVLEFTGGQRALWQQWLDEQRGVDCPHNAPRLLHAAALQFEMREARGLPSAAVLVAALAAEIQQTREQLVRAARAAFAARVQAAVSAT